MSHELKRFFSTNEFYGGVGQTLHAIEKGTDGEQIAAIGAISRFIQSIPPDASSSVHYATVFAALSAYMGKPRVAEAFIRDIATPVAFNVPEAALHSSILFGHRNSPLQQAMKNSGALVRTVEGARGLYEGNDFDIRSTIGTLWGVNDENTVAKAGLERVEFERNAGLVALGAAALTTIGIFTGALDHGIVGATLVDLLAAGGGSAELMKSIMMNSALHLEKETIKAYLAKERARVAPLATMFLNLNDRRVFCSIKEDTGTNHRTIRQIMYPDAPGTVLNHPAVDGPIANTSLAQFNNFSEQVLFKDEILLPLSEVMQRGLALEEERTADQIEAGRDPRSALPIITADSIKQPGVQEKLIAASKERHEATKMLSRAFGVDNRIDRMSLYLGLFTQYPDLSLLLRPDAEWMGGPNLTKRRGMEDLNFHQQPGINGRNYIGCGIATSLIQEFYSRLPNEEYATKGYATEAQSKMFKAAMNVDNNGTPKFITSLSEVPLTELEGPNALNSYGRLIMTLLTAAHQDANNSTMGEGAVKESTSMSGLLIADSLENAGHMFTTLALLSNQTYAMNAGKVLVEQLTSTNANGQFIGTLQQGINNIEKSRLENVQQLLGLFLTSDRKKFMTDPDPKDKNKYPFDLMYFAMSWIMKEMPDLAPQISLSIQKMMTRSGMNNEAVDLGFEVTYAMFYLKQQATNEIAADKAEYEKVKIKVPETEKSQRIIDHEMLIESFEGFLVNCAHHAVNYISNSNFARLGMDRLSRNAQYLNCLLGMINEHDAIQLSIVLNKEVSKIIQNGAVASADRRPFAKDPNVDLQTALSDALGFAIQNIDARIRYLPDNVSTYDDLIISHENENNNKSRMQLLEDIQARLQSTLTDYHRDVNVSRQGGGNQQVIMHSS